MEASKTQNQVEIHDVIPAELNEAFEYAAKLDGYYDRIKVADFSFGVTELITSMEQGHYTVTRETLSSLIDILGRYASRSREGFYGNSVSKAADAHEAMALCYRIADELIKFLDEDND